MLGLGHQIAGDPLRESPGVGDHDYLARSLRSVDSNSAEYLQLGRRHIVVSGTDDLVDRRDAFRTKRHSRYRLGAAHGIHFVKTE